MLYGAQHLVPTSPNRALVTPLAHDPSMDALFGRLAAVASNHFGMLSLDDLRTFGVSSSRLSRWVSAGLVERIGPRSFRVAGSPLTWRTRLAAGLADVDGAFIAGRAAAALHRLDGFDDGPVELIVERKRRHRRRPATVRSTDRELHRGDTVLIDGLRCLTAERLIVEAPLFRFGNTEIENAIDSAIRMRKVSEPRLRARIESEQWQGVPGARRLLGALLDAGGEGYLERRFLRLVREAGLARPQVQRVFREDGRTIARVDACFGDDLIVEVDGHATHATRRQRQADAQRRTELMLRGYRVMTFTYEDVTERPAWVIAQIVAGLVPDVA